MPTIRIEEDVFEGLKKLAEPFVDTPGAVIRRLLVEKGIIQSSPTRMPPRVIRPHPDAYHQKGPAATLTPQQIYEQFLLVTLEQRFAGKGDKRGVTQAVIERMVKHGFIGPADLELVSTGETKAENTITWARNALKNRALIARGSRRGVWELTEDGREAARDLQLPRSGPERDQPNID